MGIVPFDKIPPKWDYEIWSLSGSIVLDRIRRANSRFAMTPGIPSWRLIVLILGVVLPFCAHASPSINVAVQASFDAGPYLVELLETAAAENATSYFPLLDCIAEGTFEDLGTEKELYDRFMNLVQEDGHLQDSESLSSFKFALAIRSATPRIEAHYQYYNTSVQPSLMIAQDAACPVWVHADGKQYCSSTLERAQQDVNGQLDSRELPFDRILGDISAPSAILYADITSPMFNEFHVRLSALAREGQISYRIRYRKPQHGESRPLFVSSYGVELVLKRTDYIMIDDRDAQQLQQESSRSSHDTDLVGNDLIEESPADLKPLSSSEVARLGVNAASFVLNSAKPFDTLAKLSQDFPRHSATIAHHNVSRYSPKELRLNHANVLPPGYNVMWINGLQMSPRQIDAYSLLEHLRRERKLIANFRALGFSVSEAVDLISYPTITKSQADTEPQRYDYRDNIEGGGVIIWLNDLEKDKRYSGWPTSTAALLQRMFPGQLPNVRRDVHNVVIPIDLTSLDEIRLVVDFVLVFIKRKVPVRFGLVPAADSRNSIEQLRIAHHLHDAYGLSALVRYLEELSNKKSITANKPAFQLAVTDRELRTGATLRSFEDVLHTKELDEAISRTTAYLKRLDCDGYTDHTFVNGIVLPRNENWLQEMPSRLFNDLHILQQGIMENLIEEDIWLPGYFLSNAMQSRARWITPTETSDIRLVNLVNIDDARGNILKNLPRVASSIDYVGAMYTFVVGDFDTEMGFNLLAAALKFHNLHADVEMVFLHNPKTHTVPGRVSSTLYQFVKGTNPVRNDAAHLLSKIESPAEVEAAEGVSEYWKAASPLLEDLGFASGDSGIVLNGRAVGPPPSNIIITEKEFELLLAYEKSKSIDPIFKTLTTLGLGSKISDAFSFAKLSSLIALATLSDIPEGLFESGSRLRSNPFKEWNETSSAITVSNSADATISIVASIDPTTEQSQRWIPILKVLSTLVGVNVNLFLNPRSRIQELPITRFYRHVLEVEPSFDGNGALMRPGASFSGVPEEALLNLGMDVPPSWLVAPKESIHDLDNIKLSSLNVPNVDAIYDLEHILIEGHSRDTTTNSPPRGVQLLLGSESDPQFADTIIMANLGYFQFKTQPGLWKINLKPGRSQRIFNLDSIGGLGYNPKPGDESTEVTLMSFQGKTLFPRLSRKPGHEDEDVLETGPKPGSAMDYVSMGLNLAAGVFSSVGIGSKSEVAEKHADINIFSVASGHLYERMLNIMMVSVIRHTKHSVKFWFIEQFLSPSFKSFLPHLAAEYGFSYEMVTYKWPHWLRGQHEKQREIWGYKILFLDVLFPLSLDKVIFVDADQIVRTDMYDLVALDLEGAPYGFTPMCDSRESMEGFRFWKQGYWKSFLQGLPYHISALFVVDLNRFRALAAGDRLRGQYQALSADPASLSNLDQDLPNHMQHIIPIKSLSQDWLWCETWCSDEALTTAKTIDLCNNPLTKEPKLDRARRQVPEWIEYDDEIAALATRLATADTEEEVAQAPAEPEDASENSEGAEPSKEHTRRDRKDEL